VPRFPRWAYEINSIGSDRLERQTERVARAQDACHLAVAGPAGLPNDRRTSPETASAAVIEVITGPLIENPHGVGRQLAVNSPASTAHGVGHAAFSITSTTQNGWSLS